MITAPQHHKQANHFNLSRLTEWLVINVIYHVFPKEDKGEFKINGLVQERRNSIANALELRLSCTNPSKWPPFVVPPILPSVLWSVLASVRPCCGCCNSTTTGPVSSISSSIELSRPVHGRQHGLWPVQASNLVFDPSLASNLLWYFKQKFKQPWLDCFMLHLVWRYLSHGKDLALWEVIVLRVLLVWHCTALLYPCDMVFLSHNRPCTWFSLKKMLNEIPEEHCWTWLWLIGGIQGPVPISGGRNIAGLGCDSLVGSRVLFQYLGGGTLLDLVVTHWWDPGSCSNIWGEEHCWTWLWLIGGIQGPVPISGGRNIAGLGCDSLVGSRVLFQYLGGGTLLDLAVTHWWDPGSCSNIWGEEHCWTWLWLIGGIQGPVPISGGRNIAGLGCDSLVDPGSCSNIWGEEHCWTWLWLIGGIQGPVPISGGRNIAGLGCDSLVGSRVLFQYLGGGTLLDLAVTHWWDPGSCSNIWGEEHCWTWLWLIGGIQGPVPISGGRNIAGLGCDSLVDPGSCSNIWGEEHCWTWLWLIGGIQGPVPISGGRNIAGLGCDSLVGSRVLFQYLGGGTLLDLVVTHWWDPGSCSNIWGEEHCWTWLWLISGIQGPVPISGGRNIAGLGCDSLVGSRVLFQYLGGGTLLDLVVTHWWDPGSCSNIWGEEHCWTWLWLIGGIQGPVPISGGRNIAGLGCDSLVGSRVLFQYLGGGTLLDLVVTHWWDPGSCSNIWGEEHCWTWLWLISGIQGPVPISDKTSYRKISWSLEATRLVF